jgi:hypothetical protein
VIALLMLIAAEPSPIAIGDHLVVGYSLTQENGELPSFALDPEFDRYTSWVHVRGGVVDSQPNTQLGTELGFEFELRLGFTPDESSSNSAPAVDTGGRTLRGSRWSAECALRSAEREASAWKPTTRWCRS